MTHRRVILVILCLGLLGVPAPGAPQDAVVRIVATSDNTQDRLGSGFFVNADGRLITCYHVVLGATKLLVLDGVHMFRDIAVEAIAPDYDLAILQVRDRRGPVPFIPIANVNPATFWKTPIEAYGYPSVLGLATQARSFLAVRSLVDKFSPSVSIRSADLEKTLFAKQIDVIPIEMTIYNGDSGGPLVYNDRAVGIISGSIQEGGSIAWAIPAKYTNFLTTVNKLPNAVIWPPLSLMSDNWRPITRQARLGSRLLVALDLYASSLDEFMSESAGALQEAKQNFPAADVLATINQEIQRHGARYPAEKDKNLVARALAVEQQMEGQSTRSAEKIDSAGEKFSEARENLAKEMVVYFNSLSTTPKNLALAKNTLLRWRQIGKDEDALADKGDDSLDAFENHLGPLFEQIETLGDARRAFSELISATQGMWRQQEVYLQAIRDKGREAQQIFEHVFDVDRTPVGTKK